MQKISLKEWVVLLTIVPTTVIGISIASYFSYQRYVELDDFLALRATSIIEPLAITSSEHLQHKNREKLRELIGFAHRSHSTIIKSITVFTLDHQVFVTSAYHGDTNLLRLNNQTNIPSNTSRESIDDYVIFRTPIINEYPRLNDSNDHIENLGYITLQIDRSTLKFDQQTELLTAFFIVLVGSFVSGFFTFKLIKNVTRPVTSMVQAVDRIREGKLESRVSGQLIGELNFLKNGINAMAQSLGDYHDEMQRSIDQATLDLRESLEQFEIQNVELDLAKRKAQDANRVKSEFLANMSHELRTPLNGVLGFTRQVLKTPLTDTQRDYLETIERSANNLLAIINDILDFSKLDAGKMIIEKIPFIFRDAIEETITLLAPSAHKKNIEFSYRVASNIPDGVIGDAMRIKQILLNLANNAIKFTQTGFVTIDIDCDQNDGKQALLKFTITDTGIGMSKKQQASLFEAFSQADKSVTRLYGGTGLGLVISQRLAEEMQGDIGFHSNKDQGSSFWFTCQCEINPVQIKTSIDTSPLHQQPILYFEPQDHSRMATSRLLETWGMEVTPCTSIEELTNILINENHYQHALIGYNISPTALNDLKELLTTLAPKINNIHFAINSNSPSLQEALLSAGAKSCLSKPIIPSRLLKELMPHASVAEQNNNTKHCQKLPIKVLAVDDNDANLKLIKALLLEQVTDVATAVNGEHALRMAENEKFALIFMDIQMPVMDGATALSKIRTETFNESTPIIAVTAHALAGEKEKLLQQGFDSYMTKPIDEAMLKHTIYEYCDTNLFTSEVVPELLNTPLLATKTVTKDASNQDIDWPLAIKRAGNKEDLARDMLAGLIKTLPETKLSIEDAISCQDTEQVKTLIHKLNGACCYCGVPNLSKIIHQIETQLKQDASLTCLEPEFFEFAEHIERLIVKAPRYLS
ncbi:two-component sensor histidine kinase BarA [Thalassotalea agariperforans]